jgi:glycosyltransferase involved in cell wall biosynthesis
MKILLLIRQFGFGGSEARLDYLYNSFNEYNKIEYRKHSMVGQDPIYGSSSEFEKSKLIRFLNLYKIIKQFKPDIIHSFDISSGIYAKLISFLFLNKIKIISGSGASREDNFWMQLALRLKILQPSIYIFNSSAGAKFLSKFIPKSIPISVIHNGININKFSGINFNEFKPDWYDPNAIYIGYIGKLDNYKFGQRVIEIAALFEKEIIKPIFVIIGSGPYLNRAINDVNNSTFLSKHVKILGKQKDSFRLIPFFHIGILCSDTEGFPNVILEFMLAGVPIVSTEVGDIRTIYEGTSGLIIPKYKAQEFKDAIMKLITNINLYNQISLQCKQKVNNNYSLEKMINNYNKVYNDLI